MRTAFKNVDVATHAQCRLNVSLVPTRPRLQRIFTIPFIALTWTGLTLSINDCRTRVVDKTLYALYRRKRKRVEIVLDITRIFS